MIKAYSKASILPQYGYTSQSVWIARVLLVESTVKVGVDSRVKVYFGGVSGKQCGQPTSSLALDWHEIST